MPRRRPQPPPRRPGIEYPKADHELTPEEIREQYGDVIDAFLDGLQEDSQLLADFVAAVVIVADLGDRRREAQERYRARRKAEKEAAAQTG